MREALLKTERLIHDFTMKLKATKLSEEEKLEIYDAAHAVAMACFDAGCSSRDLSEERLVELVAIAVGRDRVDEAVE